MAEPLVSVLIPTFNRRALVVGAVESVLAQGVRDLEVLVVDDGGSDGTAAHVEAAFASEPRVRVLRQANGGISAARNTALAASRGRYVGLLDDDDRWLPTFLERQIALLEAHPRAWLAIADGAPLVHLPGRAERISRWPDCRLDLTLDAVLAGRWALPSGWLLRGDRARALRFDAALRHCEDMDLVARLCLAGGEVVAQPEVLFRYTDAFDGPGAPRLTSDRAALYAGKRALALRYQAHARDARAHRRFVHKLEREEARVLLDAGRPHDARPLVARWLRRRPLDPAAWRAWRRARALARQGSSASASTSINASGS